MQRNKEELIEWLVLEIICEYRGRKEKISRAEATLKAKWILGEECTYEL